MNDIPFYISSTPKRWRLIAMALATVVTGWPTVSLSQCITQLKGKAYINLPQGVCPRYTDMLLGPSQPKQPRYGGVICDRPDESYILLQKLLKYTDQGKAVWEVVQVQQISKPTPQSFVKGTGCQLQRQSQTSNPIFALVQPTPNNTYLTLAAWSVNLIEASFKTLEPRTVICQDRLL
jgi:hypothetical protein